MRPPRRSAQALLRADRRTSSSSALVTRSTSCAGSTTRRSTVPTKPPARTDGRRARTAPPTTRVALRRRRRSPVADRPAGAGDQRHHGTRPDHAEETSQSRRVDRCPLSGPLGPGIPRRRIGTSCCKVADTLDFPPRPDREHAECQGPGSGPGRRATRLAAIPGTVATPCIRDAVAYDTASLDRSCGERCWSPARAPVTAGSGRLPDHRDGPRPPGVGNAGGGEGIGGGVHEVSTCRRGDRRGRHRRCGVQRVEQFRQDHQDRDQPPVVRAARSPAPARPAMAPCSRSRKRTPPAPSRATRSRPRSSTTRSMASTTPSRAPRT